MTWSDKELENERPKTSGDISKSPVELLQILRDGDSEALREALYALELNAKLIRLALSLRAVRCFGKGWSSSHHEQRWDRSTLSNTKSEGVGPIPTPSLEVNPHDYAFDAFP